jgi:hypothetical protein
VDTNGHGLRNPEAEIRGTGTPGTEVAADQTQSDPIKPWPGMLDARCWMPGRPCHYPPRLTKPNPTQSNRKFRPLPPSRATGPTRAGRPCPCVDRVFARCYRLRLNSQWNTKIH